MVGIKKISVTSALLLSVADQALAAPIASNSLSLRSDAGVDGSATVTALERSEFEDLDERDFDELDERDLDERSPKRAAGGRGGAKAKASGPKKTVKKASSGGHGASKGRGSGPRKAIKNGHSGSRPQGGHTGGRKTSLISKVKGAVGRIGKNRGRDLEADDLVIRDPAELEERDIDELDERDLEELDERDFEELDERDLEELDERDLEERSPKRAAGAKVKSSTPKKSSKGKKGPASRPGSSKTRVGSKHRASSTHKTTKAGHSGSRSGSRPQGGKGPHAGGRKTSLVSKVKSAAGRIGKNRGRDVEVDDLVLRDSENIDERDIIEEVYARYFGAMEDSEQ